MFTALRAAGESNTPLNVLLGSKAEAEAHFGSKSVMAINLVRMINQGEKAWKFTSAGMNVGYETTIGIFNGKVRYAAFRKMSSKRILKSCNVLSMPLRH